MSIDLAELGDTKLPCPAERAHLWASASGPQTPAGASGRLARTAARTSSTVVAELITATDAGSAVSRMPSNRYSARR